MKENNKKGKNSKLKEKIKLPVKKQTKKKEKIKKDKPKKVLWKSILNVLLIIAISLISLGLLFALYIVISSPDFEKDKLYQKEPTILYDKNGLEFARVGAANATVVTYDEIPDVLIDALVATEDSRFFQHNGIDLFRFLKASILQLLGQDDAGGASTLDMQLMKNRYTQTDTNTGANANPIEEIIRKFQDVYMSVFKLEANYTKEEIIEFYLNTFQFGGGNINLGGTFGIEQACQYFFGKSSKDINLAEATIIAGMFQAPYRYNPYKNPEGCKNRQKIVLNLMVRHGYITQEQMDDVMAIPVESLVIDHEEENNMEVESNQAFIDYVLDEVSEDLGIDARKASLEIYTTFDPSIQAVLEKAENGTFFKFINEKDDEGIAVTSSVDGSIVALSGGRNYVAQGDSNATDIKRQPGSTAKPITEYAMYIQNISKSTYAMFLDEAITYSNSSQVVNNYDNKHDGLITMRWAVQDSRNIPAVLAFRALADMDKTIMLDFLDKLNIHPEDEGELYEPDAIGGWKNGISPLLLSAAYGTFARGGYYIEPYAYTKVIDPANNNREYPKSYTKEKVMEEWAAYLMTDLLISANSAFRKPSGAQVGGKTGTTNYNRNDFNFKVPSTAVSDIWMATISPKYSIALWYGYDKITEEYVNNGWYLKNSDGIKARSNIMGGLSTNIHKNAGNFKVPKNIIEVKIEKETFPAQLCSAYTPTDMCLTELFLKGTEPTNTSNRYDTLSTPTNGSYTYSGNTITIKWDEITIPDAINPTYLQQHFNTYYDSNYSQKYYDARIAYNNKTFGTLGYRIYLVNSNGEETEIGYTNSNTYSYNVTESGEYTFKVKASYSLFRNNMSNALTINTKTIDSNIEDWVDDQNDQDQDTGSN